MPYSCHLSEFNDRGYDHSSTNGCRARNKLSIDYHKLILVRTHDRSPRYVKDRRAKRVSDDTTVRDSTNCIGYPPTHIFEEKRSEGKRNIACHTT